MTFYTPDRRDVRKADSPPSSVERAGRPRAALFSRWDGTQSIPDLDADELVDALADDVMADGDVGEALRRLLERGLRSDDPTRQDLAGLRDLIEQLQDRRRELLDQYKLGDVLGDVRRELDDIVAEERVGVERRLADASTPAPETDPSLHRMLRDAAAKRLDRLDALHQEDAYRIPALAA